MGGHRISPPFRPDRPVVRRALSTTRVWEAGLKKAEEVMEILEAFDLVGTLRGAAELVGCDHKTVAHWVRAREAAGGGLPVAVRPRPAVGPFADKVEELVERSRGKIRADRAHETLVAMGYVGSERTTRRAVAEAKRRYRQEHGRRTRPWIPEPGLWMQWDYADGPLVSGRSTSLFCAWLAWSRFRLAPLRADDSDLRAGRPAVEGRLGGDGQDRQGRSRADRPQPASRLRVVRRARARVRAPLRARERAPAPRHAASAGAGAGRRTRAAQPAARGAAHALLWPDQTGVVAGDDLARRRDLLGAARAGRRARLGASGGPRARRRPRRRARRPAR